MELYFPLNQELPPATCNWKSLDGVHRFMLG